MKTEADTIRKSPFSCQREGLTLRGFICRKATERQPIAIVSHGFMANQRTVQKYARFLAELGYTAFTFDFSGGSVFHNRSDGRTTDMSVLSEVDDLQAVIRYACSLSYTDSGNILLMGCSQGGLVSALTAAKNSPPIRTLVLFYPAFCIPDDARRGHMMWARFDPDHIPDILQCGPMKLGRRYAQDVMDLDPFEKIRTFQGNVLIVHGTADRIVDPRYAFRAGDVYRHRSGGGLAETAMIDGAGHSFFGRKDRDALNCLKRFLERCEKIRHASRPIR